MVKGVSIEIPIRANVPKPNWRITNGIKIPPITVLTPPPIKKRPSSDFKNQVIVFLIKDTNFLNMTRS